MDTEDLPVPGVPARLHVMLARDASFGVIVRRGPVKRVCTISWNLDHDTFKVGQWLKGRIYEDRLSDISPDGRHLLYLAAKYNVVDGGQYTVLSRAPYLKALKIWHGEIFYGGAFLDNDRFSLLGNRAEPKIFRVSPFGEVRNAPELAQISRVSQHLLWKLERDGWNLSDDKTHNIFRWHKRFLGCELAFSIQGDLFYPKRRTYAFFSGETKAIFDCARWDWADFRGERLLWAQDGKIFASRVWEGGHRPSEELADFNNWTFEPIVAPY